MRNIRSIIASGLVIALSSCGTSVTKVEHNPAVPQTEYAASLINSYVPSMQKGYKIKIGVAENPADLPQEGFTIKRKGKTINIIGNDASGAIYGANRLLEYYKLNGNLEIPTIIVDAPEMKIRGAAWAFRRQSTCQGTKFTNILTHPRTSLGSTTRSCG